MNKLLYITVFILSIHISAQTFHSLDGIENQQGETMLLYRLGSTQLYSNPIYKFNVQTGYEQQIMEAHEIYFPVGADIKTVLDFEFFPADTNNFMNVGALIFMDYNSYIARNDSIVSSSFSEYFGIDISKQDPQKIFAFGGPGVITRSWDGGITFPEDSIPAIVNFIAISVADFDDNVWFGLNEESQLVKTGVGIVDTSLIFNAKFYYDVNQFHIYRVNETYGGYTLNVSNNKGNAYTWTKTYQSENPIFISIDPSVSGVIYLADGRKIYKSVNNGYTFNLYKSLPHILVGIYNKPNSDILYAASKSKIFKLTPDSTIIIKTLPFSDELLKYYPLAVGNFWLYNVVEWSDPFYYSHSTFSRKVISKDTLSNSKEYFKIEEKYYESNYVKYVFERIDKENGLAYRFDNECTNPDSEKVIEHFTAEIGDSLLIQRYTSCWDSILTVFSLEETENVLGEIRNFRAFEYNWLMGYAYRIAKGIGIYSLHQGYCFGYTNSFLKGCVIDGIVYGDTIVTDVDDDKEAIPTEFSLSQNYPNPFNPNTIISYQLPVTGKVSLKVYDILGKEVATLVSEEKPVGRYEVEFSATNLSSGIYFYKLTAGTFTTTKKMLLIK